MQCKIAKLDFEFGVRSPPVSFVYMHVCVFVLLARNITTALMLFFAYFCIKFTNVAFDLPCLNAISHKIPPLFYFQNSSKDAKINTDIYQFS